MTEAAGNRPTHIAIIMDGNGRWAKQRNLPRLEGHRAGAKAVERTLRACKDNDIPYLTLYAFSSENWRRPADEVNGLMRLLVQFLERYRKNLIENEIRLNIIGDFSRLPGAVQRKLEEILDATSHFEGYTLTLALSYGSRPEIATATKAIAEKVLKGDMRVRDIDETTVRDHLYTHGLPDPDLLIRTGGELRLSNFLLWQASYTELWFTETLWPDFSEEHFQQALRDYAQRTRRFGSVKND